MTCQECCRLLPDYLEERLPDSDRKEADAHLSGCPECAAFLDAQLKDMGELAPILPRWNITDTAWEAALEKGRARVGQRRIRPLFPQTFQYALAAAMVLAAALFLWRAKTPQWQLTPVEKRITLSEQTIIQLAAGTEYRLEGGAPGDSFFLLNVHRGEAVLSVEKHRFKQAAVVLPTTVVRVTGTFFRVKTVGALDFRVELLEGGVDIETAVRPIHLEQGKAVVKEGEQAVIRPLTLIEEQSLQEHMTALLGIRQPAEHKGGKSGAAPPETTPQPMEPDTVQSPSASPEPVPVNAPPTGPVGAKPYSIKEGVEVWDAEVNFPARAYEELEEIEFINGINGAALEKLAVFKAKQLKAAGFIVLSAGLMGTDVVSEIEFRGSPDNKIEAAGMNMKDYGADYETDHFAVRKQVRQSAFRMRVRFFRYIQ